MYRDPINDATVLDFYVAPTGWYNYYKDEDETGKEVMFREPCPGWLKMQMEDGSIEIHAASHADCSYLSPASQTSNYHETRFGVEFWEQAPENYTKAM